MKIGMIGAGKHARANIYPAAQLAGAEIVAVSARHRERAEAAAAAVGARSAYDDFRTMLERESLDAVFVVVPERQQLGVVREVLHAGHDVFVEKPLGLTVAEAEEMAALAARLGRKVMVGFMKRFAPGYVELKRVAGEEDTFGTPLSLQGMFAIGAREGWGDEWFVKTGGVHYVDLLRFLFGEVRDACGFRNSRGDQVDVVCTVRFERGQIGGLFFAGLPAWTRHHEELTVTGVKGFAKVENLTRLVYHLDQPKAPGPPRWQLLDEVDQVVTPVSTSGSGGWRDLYLNGFVGEIQHFLDCLRHDREPVCSAADNVKTMALCEQILQTTSR